MRDELLVTWLVRMCSRRPRPVRTKPSANQLWLGSINLRPSPRRALTQFGSMRRGVGWCVGCKHDCLALMIESTQFGSQWDRSGHRLSERRKSRRTDSSAACQISPTRAVDVLISAEQNGPTSDVLSASRSLRAHSLHSRSAFMLPCQSISLCSSEKSALSVLGSCSIASPRKHTVPIFAGVI